MLSISERVYKKKMPTMVFSKNTPTKKNGLHKKNSKNSWSYTVSITDFITEKALTLILADSL